MIRTLLLAAILTGCSGLSDEEFYGPNTMASCWTVDGDPLLYFYIPAGEKMSDEFKQECNAMHRAAQSHRNEPARAPNE